MKKTILSTALFSCAAVSLSAQTIYIDLGNTEEAGNWNEIYDPPVTTPYNLVDFNTG